MLQGLMATAAVLALQLLPGPAIGGSVAAFAQVLGGPNGGSVGAQLHYLRCAGTEADKFVVLAPNDQVWTIQRQWCDLATVSADQRFADAARFLPPDAEAGAPFTTEQGEPALTYQSPGLGAALPAGP